MTTDKKKSKPLEIALIGDVDDWEDDVIKQMLDAKPRRDCVLYFDSLGGSVYGALAVTTLMRQRQLQCTGVVLGECSSAALLILAACQKRLVTRHSTMLFHRMRWQSEKRVGAGEAGLWARHFDGMEKDIDELQARLFGAAEREVREWTDQGRYVSGKELADAGLAELFEI